MLCGCHNDSNNNETSLCLRKIRGNWLQKYLMHYHCNWSSETIWAEIASKIMSRSHATVFLMCYLKLRNRIMLGGLVPLRVSKSVSRIMVHTSVIYVWMCMFAENHFQLKDTLYFHIVRGNFTSAAFDKRPTVALTQLLVECHDVPHLYILYLPPSYSCIFRPFHFVVIISLDLDYAWRMCLWVFVCVCVILKHPIAYVVHVFYRRYVFHAYGTNAHSVCHLWHSFTINSVWKWFVCVL